MRGAECWTDHRLVRGKFKFQIWLPIHKQAPRKKLNCAALKDPPTNQAEDLDDKWRKFCFTILKKSLIDWFDENNEAIHQLLNEKGKRNTSLALTFIDFRKAFDLVDHINILRKSIEIGLHPNLVTWLSNFFSEHRQCVRFKGSISTPQRLTCGVPQGAKMESLCFLMLINDALAESSHHWKYVDGSTVNITVDNTAPDYSSLQATLDKVQAWTTDNHLIIKSIKTVTMHFFTSKKDVPASNVTISTQSLHVVKSTKLLGITIDDWKQRVTNTVRAASYRPYMQRRLRSLGTPDKELKNIYSTFILPNFCYASPAWIPSINLTQEQQLQRIKKRACKIIPRLPLFELRI
ncbi:uncharacterized protein LOC143021860 [Oratosquilla oratoria]|uniref:uncharacterized protein LOC143021860 n=1 Tax=Oratosquilla oratoria TaxID=337810 RepID=UPI003F764F7E